MNFSYSTIHLILTKSQAWLGRILPIAAIFKSSTAVVYQKQKPKALLPAEILQFDKVDD
jgi:hypothetical protein